jgi:hypothetical protein
MVAGKTENCMSHPDYRGTGLYSAHERACFEEEKKKYSFFFTTAGEVTGGAVGSVRQRLGYVPFDNWGKYTIWLRTVALRDDLSAKVADRSGVVNVLAPVVGGLLAAVVQAYSHLRRRPTCGYRVAIHGAATSPVEEIASLWERNRKLYGISVDRTAAYLRWRIDDDPYIDHEYLTMHGDDGLLGYVISYVQNDTLYVVDLLVAGASTELFRCLLTALTRRARELGVVRIHCLALRRSRLLPRVLRSAGFVDTAELSPVAWIKRVPPRQFFLYIPEELRHEPRFTDHANWYITELVLEGRLRGT